eukprot:93819-Hanusia_phi.AAC.1
MERWEKRNSDTSKEKEVVFVPETECRSPKVLNHSVLTELRRAKLAAHPGSPPPGSIRVRRARAGPRRSDCGAGARGQYVL